MQKNRSSVKISTSGSDPEIEHTPRIIIGVRLRLVSMGVKLAQDAKNPKQFLDKEGEDSG